MVPWQIPRGVSEGDVGKVRELDREGKYDITAPGLIWIVGWVQYYEASQLRRGLSRMKR